MTIYIYLMYLFNYYMEKYKQPKYNCDILSHNSDFFLAILFYVSIKKWKNKVIATFYLTSNFLIYYIIFHNS